MFNSFVAKHRHQLFKLNVRSGDHVVVIGNNSVHWAALYFATTTLGATIVPLYKNMLSIVKEYVIAQTKPKVVLTDTLRCDGGDELDMPTDIDEDGYAAILYTSGTTGKSKGVMLTHRNLMSNIEAVETAFPQDCITHNDKYVNILPWSHCYGLTYELNYLFSKGASVYINQDNKQFLNDLLRHDPTIVCAVPRIFNSIYNSYKSRNIENMREQIFGKKIRFCTTGGSTISPQVLDFFHDMGVPLYQAYGMTETSPLISISTPLYNKKGSVGKPLACNEVFIIKDNQPTNQTGEVCVRGSNVMKGYLNNNVANNKAFFHIDCKGPLLHTGDKGFIDTDGFLSIVGRIKDEYKLSNGKYVNPTEVEDMITTHVQSIQQIMICGDGRDYNVAVVVANNEQTETTLLQEIQHIKTLRKFDVPKRILVITEPFTIENHLLTPKMSLRREKILAKYQSEINNLYTSY